MKVLVFGSKGWIGGQFTPILDIQGIEYKEAASRVDDINSLEKEIKEYNPTHVISFIGRTHGYINGKYIPTIDYLEQDRLSENVRDNLFSPLQLAILSQKYNFHYTYIGTGCIFEYDAEHDTEKGFTEDSLPNFFGSSYSIVKGYTDRLLKLFEESTLNLRIRMPINSEKCSRNFVSKITNYDKVCSIANSMTVLPELLPYIVKMMEMNLKGTLNLTNPGVISHNEILAMYKEIVDPNFTWKNFTIEEQNKILASKRSNNFLETHRLQELFPEIKNIKDSVRECLKSYPKPVYNITNDPSVKLLVTGGCGFIGSNFVNYIHEEFDKINVLNLDTLNYCANVNNVNKMVRDSPRYKFVKADLKNFELIENILNNERPTHVVHFAAQSHVDNSFSDSLLFTNDNIVGTHNLLEISRKLNLKLFIHVSTDEVYGESMIEDGESQKNEQSILCPTNPYAATKAGAELIAKAYYFSYKMPIIISRGNNVYGPNQYPEKLIPKFIKLLKENKKVTIQGDGSNLRSFLHVSDTASAFKLILERGKVGEIYNIGCDEHMEYSVMQVAETLITKLKPADKVDNWIEYVPNRPFNDQRYYISNEKLKNLGWQIRVKFEDGLAQLL